MHHGFDGPFLLPATWWQQYSRALIGSTQRNEFDEIANKLGLYDSAQRYVGLYPHALVPVTLPQLQPRPPWLRWCREIGSLRLRHDLKMKWPDPKTLQWLR